ncbi:uncharacterized protein KY384_004223 [Bacidia gigantensis]|uniref:uncharacterized protein n=1 Tax=Bacidia gigantensis TaxID=2732470 RepID=UPI001D05BFBA|nr:uncharacterized protein KY384_004223 [Bacidia gigantensis]KAG8530866.1 hypothetical protein KY384_004223 [Bacidia gigantensis]
MTSTQPNPRRGYKTGVHPTSSFSHTSTAQHAHHTSSAEPDRALKKSATFHSPKSPAAEDDPILHIPLLSRRSPTSPTALRDAVAAGEQRVSQLLGSVDRSLSGLETFSTDSQETIRPDEHPVPRFMLDGTINTEDHMDIDSLADPVTPLKSQHRHNRHFSDSGIGSSITASDGAESRDDAGKSRQYKQSYTATTNTHQNAAQILADLKRTYATAHSVHSGINGTSESDAQHALSAYACRQIQKYLILPILKEETLKKFHPLVTGIPVRVGRKEITCLRDLEKVLLYLAPVSGSSSVWERRLAHCFGFQRFSESRSAFLRFCETSIQCLHTTVDHLNDPDQRRPSDRPYTNSYFVDLTEQIRQYAAMISAARQRLVAGETHDDDEEMMCENSGNYQLLQMLTSARNSKISLEGGIGQTGRPAQLVRTSNGRSISLRTGEEIDLQALRDEAGIPNSDEMDEEILLSMARRRKAAEKVIHRCGECDKEFKRPCDLTKHEKTHSRPWKCNEPTCKYSHYGWPTEKERDRHVNDKHSSTPAMYKCQFHPCPYESKRESNCKQHMEKAHGWAYVRSKNNGKTGRKASKSSSRSSPTQQMTTPRTQVLDGTESDFGDSSASPYLQSSSDLHSSIAGTSPYLSMNEAYTPSPFEPNFTFDQPTQTLTPTSPFTPASHRLSLDNGVGPNDVTMPSYDTTFAGTDMPLFNDTFDWSNMDTGFQSMNIQLFTPAASVESGPMDGYNSRNPSISVEQPIVHDVKLSPGAQGALMLYSPNDGVIDEGYDEFSITDMGKPTNDFALFDDTRPESSMGHGGMNLFETLPPFQSQTWTGQHVEPIMMEE